MNSTAPVPAQNSEPNTTPAEVQAEAAPTTEAVVQEFVPGIAVDYVMIKDTPLGILAGAALRAFVATNPDGMSRIRLRDFKIGVTVNGQPVDMNVFKQIVNTDSEFSAMKTKIKGLVTLSEGLSEKVKLISPSEIAKVAVQKMMEQLQSVNVSNMVDTYSALTSARDSTGLQQDLITFRTEVANLMK